MKLKENTRVIDFELQSGNKIKKIRTNHGTIFAENIINAAGGWSPQIFDSIGIKIPVSLQPVYVSNWLISKKKLPKNFPMKIMSLDIGARSKPSNVPFSISDANLLFRPRAYAKAMADQKIPGTNFWDS